MADEIAEFSVTLEQIENYEFRVSFGAPAGELVVDEAPPLGAGAGPSPSRMLAAAVGHCLCASLLFCARKARIKPGRIRAQVKTHAMRNDGGRLRIGRIEVNLDPDFAPGANAARCLAIFRDFCTVSESVRQGIPIDVNVREPIAPVPAS